MPSPLAALGVTHPVLAAPMAGGASTPAYVTAAADAGSLGVVAGGYKTPDVLAEQLATVRAHTSVFGVNLFAPNPLPVDRAQFRRYADVLQPEAERYGVELGREPVEDDDYWAAKIDLLLADPPPLVSFTFGIPDATVLQQLKRAGTTTLQTVTTVAEARLAAEAGVDALVVQASGAGGHSGTFTPHVPPADVPLAELVRAVRAEVDLPVFGTGGVSTPAGVTAALEAGAAAVLVGSVLLRADESGTSDVHRAALADPSRGDPVLTHAFTGRPARGLPNRFIAAYEDLAPFGYPALHHLTSELRKAAAAAGDPEAVHLWAGTGYRDATDEPVGTILTRLAGTS